MASGWESEGPEFEPWQPQITFDPAMPKKFDKNIPSLIVVSSMIVLRGAL